MRSAGTSVATVNSGRDGSQIRVHDSGYVCEALAGGLDFDGDAIPDYAIITFNFGPLDIPQATFTGDLDGDGELYRFAYPKTGFLFGLGSRATGLALVNHDAHRDMLLDGGEKALVVKGAGLYLDIWPRLSVAAGAALTYTSRPGIPGVSVHRVRQWHPLHHGAATRRLRCHWNLHARRDRAVRTRWPRRRPAAADARCQRLRDRDERGDAAVALTPARFFRYRIAGGRDLTGQP
ncbi:MAG: hypothetical protein U1E76_21925 [Planctomycetota bacterium]